MKTYCIRPGIGNLFYLLAQFEFELHSDYSVLSCQEGYLVLSSDAVAHLLQVFICCVRK